MSKSLTNMAVTRQLFCFIRRYTTENGLPPTQREMADGCFIAISSVSRHLDRLHMLGYIERLPGTMRGIVVTNPTAFTCEQEEDEPSSFFSA